MQSIHDTLVLKKTLLRQSIKPQSIWPHALFNGLKGSSKRAAKAHSKRLFYLPASSLRPTSHFPLFYPLLYDKNYREAEDTRLLKERSFPYALWSTISYGRGFLPRN